MKLFKYTTLALALAFSLASCSDDDKYVDGAQSPGAFFPTSVPDVIEIAQDGSSVSIPVSRTNLDSPTTYAITAEDESEIFTFPQYVTFEANSLTSEIVVTFDPEEIVDDEEYPFTVTIEGDASIYGKNSINGAFCRKTPLTIKNLKGTYDNEMWKKDHIEGVAVEWATSINDPDHVYVSMPRVFNTILGAEKVEENIGIRFVIDLSKKNADGEYAVDVPFQVLPFELDDESGLTAYTSLYNLALTLGNDADWAEQKWPGCSDPFSSKYNPLTGVFTLGKITYFETESGSFYGSQTEYLQLDGFPDYSVSVEYAGLMIQPDGYTMKAICSISSGKDVDEVMVANTAGTDYETLYQAILDGSVEYQTVEGNSTVNVEFAIEDPGKYTVVAVTKGGGKVQKMDFDTYTINIGAENPNQGWTSLGQGVFVDAWSGYTSGGELLQTTLEIQEKDSTPGLYRLVYPYGPTNPVTKAGYNEGDGLSYVIIDATDPNFVIMEPQFSGFIDGEDGELYMANLEGFFLSKDYTKEQIIAAGRAESTLEDFLIEMPTAFFAYSIYTDGEYYTWNSHPTGLVALPAYFEQEQAPKRITGNNSGIGIKKAKKGFEYKYITRRLPVSLR